MDIPRAASTLLTLPGSAVDALRSLPGQAQQLMEDVHRLVAEGSEALDRVRLLLDRVETLVGGVEAVVGRVEAVVGEAERVLGHADDVVRRGEAVAQDAGRAADHVAATSRRAEEQVQRIRVLLDDNEPHLRRLVPLLEVSGETFRPAHLTGLAQLLDRLPELVDLIDPALRGMAGMPPMSEVAERLDNVGQIVEGLPGSRMLRRRGQTKEEESSAEG